MADTLNTRRAQDIDHAISYLRAGVSISVDRVPGGKTALAVLTALYSSPGFRNVAPADIVDRTVAAWLAAWLQVEVGVAAIGSGRVTREEIVLAHPCEPNWYRDLLSDLMNELLTVVNANREDPVVASFISHVLLKHMPDQLPREEPDLVRAMSAVATRGDDTSASDRAAAGRVLSQREFDNGAWIRAAAAACDGCNPVRVVALLSLNDVDPGRRQLLAWFGHGDLWNHPESGALQELLAAAMSLKMPDWPRVVTPPVLPSCPQQWSPAAENFLGHVVTAVTRRYVVKIGSDARRRNADEPEHHLLLHRVAAVLSAWAVNPAVRDAARVLVAATEPALAFVMEVFTSIMAEWEREDRVARRRFLLWSPTLILAAALLSEVSSHVPEWLFQVGAPAVIGGSIGLLRRATAYRNWLPWPIAMAGGILLCAAQRVGVADVPHMAATAVNELGPPITWNWGITVFATVFTIFFLSVCLRIPWARAGINLSKLAPDDALPEYLAKDIDDMANRLLRK